MSPARLKIKIGTRGSPLALAQAYHVRDRLLSVNSDLKSDDFEIIIIKTMGDKLVNQKLQDFGGKGLFTKEIEEALIEKKIDIAVHSGKDVPTFRQPDLKIIATLEREDVRDAYVSLLYPHINDLPSGSIVGTASLRRTAQLLNKRSDLNIQLLRGNVQSRLKKLHDRECHATLLACAGLNRLGMGGHVSQILDQSEFIPAPAQGAIMIEVREDINPYFLDLISQINCIDTFDAITAERAFLKALDGNCRMPIAAYAEVEQDHISLIGELLSDDGTKKIRHTARRDRKKAIELGRDLGLLVKEEFAK